MVDNKEQHIRALIFEISSQRNMAMDQLADLSAHVRLQADNIKELEALVKSLQDTKLNEE